MDAAEIQTKIAKAVQQKELGNQCVASNDLSKALYHYHYCMWWWWWLVAVLSNAPSLVTVGCSIELCQWPQRRRCVSAAKGTH